MFDKYGKIGIIDGSNTPGLDSRVNFRVYDDKIVANDLDIIGLRVVGSIVHHGAEFPLYSTLEDIKFYLSSRTFDVCFSINKRAFFLSEGYLCCFDYPYLIKKISATTFVRGFGVDWSDVVLPSIQDFGDDAYVKFISSHDDTIVMNQEEISKLMHDLASCGFVTSIYTDNSCLYIPKIGFINHHQGHAGLFSAMSKNYNYTFFDAGVDSIKYLLQNVFEIIVFPSIKRSGIIEFSYVYKKPNSFFKDLLNTNRKVVVHTNSGEVEISSLSDLTEVPLYPSGKNLVVYYSFNLFN